MQHNYIHLAGVCGINLWVAATVADDDFQLTDCHYPWLPRCLSIHSVAVSKASSEITH